MATVKSLKEQNKLLAQQEERWVDIKTRADAQLKTLERGTKEYIAQEKRIAKIEKKYKAVQDKLIDIGIQAEENFDIEDKIIELEKERLDLTKSIIRRVAELPKHQKAQLETTYGITTQMDLTTDLHRAALGFQREENSEGLKTNQHIQQQGKWLEEIATDQDKLNTLQLEMAEGWANIGTGDFTSKMEEIKKLEDEMAGKRAYYLQMVGETSKYDEEAIKIMKAELDRNKELIATARDKATQQDRANALATTGAAAILGPLGKAKSALEALPFGDLISTSLQLDSVMKEFGDDMGKTLGEVASGGMSASEGMGKIGSIGGAAIDTLSTGFSSMFKMIMANPIMLIVVALTAAVGIAKLFYGGMMDTRKELGLTVAAAGKLQSSINTTALEFSLLGVSAEDVAGISASIRDNMGGLSSATSENISAMTQLSALYGISGENTGILAVQMMAVGASSVDAATAQMESVALLARANGVAPAAIMNDVAGASEAFAGFAKDGGANVFKAAIAARKLGINMGTVEQIADSLLDFESSINAQMEASMLTGRNINTDKARELALSGDLVGMQKEITKQIGSSADYEKLNIVQRKSLAAAFGVSVSELGKMVTNQDKLNSMTEGEKAHRDMIAKMLEFAGKAWAGFLTIGKALLPIVAGIAAALLVVFWPITAAVAAVTLLGMAFNTLNKHFPKLSTALGVILGLATAWYIKTKLTGKEMTGSIVKGLGEKAKGLKEKLMGGGKGKGGDKGGGIIEKAKEKFSGGKKGGKGGMGFMEKIDGKKMIQGAAALLIAAAALWVAAKALQEFAKVSWESIAMAGVTLLGLTLVLAILGKLQGQLIQGSIAMLIMSVALIPFAFALQMFTGIDFAQVALGGLAMIGFAVAMGLLGLAAPYIIMGAVAMAIMGIALIPFAVALRLFTGIDFKQVALGGVAMVGLGVALAGLGFMAPLIIAGSWALGIMSAALLVFGIALIAVGTGMTMIKNAFSGITEQITQLATMSDPILLLAKSFTVLGVSMGAMALGALMLLPALPVLFALNKMGLLGGVSLGGGGEQAEASGGTEANPVELKLNSTNAKLDELIQLMGQQGPIALGVNQTKVHTGRMADSII